MPVRSIGDLRKALGTTADSYSDEELLGAVAASKGMPIEDAAEKYGYDTNKGPWSEKFSSSIDRYQSGMSGLAGGVSRAVGAPTSVSEFFDRRRRANDISAGISASRAKEGGIPDDWRDVDGVGSGLRYIGGLASDSTPYIAEAAVGGIVGRGLRLAAGGVRVAELARGGAAADKVAAAVKSSERAGVIGGTAASYPSSVADIYGNQGEQTENGPDGEQHNLLAAAALGVPYAALNAVGLHNLVETARLPRLATTALDEVAGVKGRAARILATGAQTAISEGASETGQEFANQLGRMSVDPNESFTSDAARKRYLDSAVGGAALGFAFGGPLSGGRRSEHYRGNHAAMDTTGDAAKIEPAQDMLALPYDPNVSPAINGVVDQNSMHVFPDGSTALNSEAAFAKRYAPQPSTDPNAPINFDPTLTPHDLVGTPEPAARVEGLNFRGDPTGGLQLASTEQVQPQAGLDYTGQFDTGSLALTPTGLDQAAQSVAPAQTAPAPGLTGMQAAAANEPAAPVDASRSQDTGASPAPDAPAPVQHSGTPEAIARIEETKQRKVAATDAIARAQEAGMGSEKQQVLFWRAEELAKEQKLSDSKMTQATALLMQSKFGQVKTMLDEAAAGVPNPDQQAVVKDTTRTLKQIDSEEIKLTRQVNELGRSKADNAERKILQARLAELTTERQAAMGQGVRKAGIDPASVADPSPVQAPVRPTTANSVAESTTSTSTAPTMQASPIKAQAERANKIRRLESLLACLSR